MEIKSKCKSLDSLILSMKLYKNLKTIKNETNPCASKLAIFFAAADVDGSALINEDFKGDFLGEGFLSSFLCKVKFCARDSS